MRRQSAIRDVDDLYSYMLYMLSKSSTIRWWLISILYRPTCKKDKIKRTMLSRRLQKFTQLLVMLCTQSECTRPQGGGGVVSNIITIPADPAG